MPEQEGYLGIIRLLASAMDLMPEGPAKVLVCKAKDETIRQANQSVSSLEIGIDLGRMMDEEGEF